MTVRFGTGAPGGWIDVADQPIQPLPSAQLARLRELCLALAEDPLYEFVSSPSNAKADRITVSRAGAEVFRLRRHGANDRLPTGGSAWSVIVDGLQLPAAKDVGRRFEAALAAVRITDPVRHLAALAGPDELGTPPALAITFTGDQLAKPRWLAVAGGRLIGRVVEGYQAVLPEILASPDPDAYLDPELLAVAPDRIRKIQLAESQGAVTAVRVLDRPGGRQWRLQKLQASGDQVNRQPVGDLAAVAVEALVRGLTAVQATKVRRATAADHVAHARSLTVRVGPAEVRAAERHAVQDQDSIEQDLAWFLWRDGTDWLARDQDGLLVFTLPAMVVERLWAPLDRPLVLPVVPGQVVEVAFQRPDAEVPARLRRGPTGWRVVRSDATSAAADADEIERFLIRLAGLEGQPVPDAMPLDPLAATTVGELTLQMADAPAPWHLIIGRPLAGVVPVSAQIPGLRTAPVVHLAVDPSTLWPPIERFIASESLLQEE